MIKISYMGSRADPSTAIVCVPGRGTSVASRACCRLRRRRRQLVDIVRVARIVMLTSPRMNVRCAIILNLVQIGAQVRWPICHFSQLISVDPGHVAIVKSDLRGQLISRQHLARRSPWQFALFIDPILGPEHLAMITW